MIAFVALHTEAAYIIDATGHERALFLWPFYPQDVQRTLHSSADRARAQGLRVAVLASARGKALAPAVVALAFLASPAMALAHLRSGTVAVDYRVSVQRPDTSAYDAQIYQSDRGLRLTLKPGHTVVMLGYLHEPVFRLDGAGLWVNAASPTAVTVGVLRKAQGIDAARPRWRLQSGQRSVVWHDARVRLAPGVDRGAWSVPLIVDGRLVRFGGELRRLGAPPLLLWFLVLACMLAAGEVPLLLRRRDLARAGAIGFAVLATGASVVIALAFALDAYASPGTWIVGLDSIAFLAVGLGVLLRGPPDFNVAAAIGLGVVGLAVGLFDGAVFFHPIVLAILPGTVTRLVGVAAIGAGLNAAVLGGIFYVETATAATDSMGDLGVPAAFAGVPGRRGLGASVFDPGERGERRP